MTTTPADGPLPTGWEPEVPPDDTLLRSFLFAFADRLTWMATRLDGTVERSDEARIVDLRSPQPFDNGVVLLQPPGGYDPVELVGRAMAVFGPSTPWVLVSAWPLPDLRGMGLRLMGHPPIMMRPPGGTRPRPPPGLRIEPVADDRTLADFAAALAAGFPTPHPGAIADRVLGGPLRPYVGYVADRPVSVSVAFVASAVVDVESVATVPEGRGRGYGAALTWEATLAADRPAMLLSSDAGRSVYERMGYVPLLRCTLWYRDAGG